MRSKTEALGAIFVLRQAEDEHDKYFLDIIEDYLKDGNSSNSSISSNPTIAELEPDVMYQSHNSDGEPRWLPQSGASWFRLFQENPTIRLGFKEVKPQWD